MGKVVDFRTRAKVERSPVPDLSTQAAEGNAPNEQAPATSQPQSIAGYLVLACPCGATAVELLMGGLIVCTRCHCYSKANSWQAQPPAILPPSS